MDKEKLKNVLFFKGLDNPGLSDDVMKVLNEYLGCQPNFTQVFYARFGDGECDDRIANPESVKGKTVVMFECLKEESTMIRFLQLCWALKHQYAAERVIAVLSFIHYRRQDREEYFNEIHRNQWLAEQMKQSGISHVILVTPHSDQTRINLENNGIIFKRVDPSKVFAERLQPFITIQDREEKTKVYAPDEGSIIRAIVLAQELKLGVLFSLKSRGFNNEAEVVQADQDKIGEIKQKYSFFVDLEYATPELVNGCNIVMIEDEIDTGGTANKQAAQLKKNGAAKIFMIFTHAVCTDPWRRKLFDNENIFTQVFVSNTIPRGEEKRSGGKIHDIPIAGTIASELFKVLNSIF